MKKLLIMLGAFTLLHMDLVAQKKGEQEETFTILTGGTFAKPKIIPNMKKLALAQLTVNYKLTTEERAISSAKTGTVAGAKVTAYLKTTDAELTEADLQEITDHFYSYFQKALKANGIDTVGWSTIAATEFYQKSNGEVEEGGEKKGNVWISRTANQGNIIYGGFTGFAFAKIKAATRFCDEIQSPAGFFHVTVDFADVLVNIDVKNSTYQNLYTTTKTQNTKYRSSVAPEVKAVPTEKGFTMFWNDKSQGETLLLKKDINSGISYADNISEDASKARSGLAKQFAFSKEMTPVVIETTVAKYKAAAKKALEKYADSFIALTKSN